MDEREKMARGLLYDANHNPDLIKERAMCKDMCFAYNSLSPSDEEGKRKIAERLFGVTQLPEQAHDFRMNAVHSGVESGLLAHFAHLGVQLLLALLDDILNAGRVNAAVLDQALQTSFLLCARFKPMP